MYHIRKTKTASKSTAIQVVTYINRKVKVIAHIGSAKSVDDLKQLYYLAENWIEMATKQTALFTDSSPVSSLTLLKKCEFIGIRYQLLYEALHQLMVRFHFTALGSRLLTDLVIVRLVEPASKLRSVSLLEEYFGIKHRRQNFYESLPQFVTFKQTVEKLATDRARAELGFDLSVIFYDVTTLYCESFEADELRCPGFSKDNKANQPQVVIGLIVNNRGFPLAYEVFPGNKFEGHTFLPVIQTFKNKHQVGTLTVVADAAMISLDNVAALKSHQLTYIVGARMGNLSRQLIQEVSKQLGGADRATYRLKTAYGDLVSEFSAKRYAKDKREMDKQIAKAEKLLQQPAGIKRAKFLKANSQTKYALNQELIEKTKLLLGLKGYYTNLTAETSAQTIIDSYRNLWRVEQAFRIAKHDLEARPMFHFKGEVIRVHILICFMALVIAKYAEIKTGQSIQYILRSLKRVTDARMFDTMSKREITIRTSLPTETAALLEKLKLQY